MHKVSFGRRALSLGVGVCLAAAAVVTFGALLAPPHALADDIVAHSVDKSGNVTNYTEVYKACVAGYGGDTIVMDTDWNLNGSLEIDDSKTLVIDMNGHQIKNKASNSVIHLCEHANLTLTSSTKADFSVEYRIEENKKERASIQSGGLVTGGDVHGYGGAVRADDDSKLTLDGVSIAGNAGRSGGGRKGAGGVYMMKSCDLIMKGGAAIEYNWGFGGGVYISEPNSKVYMENATIRNNIGTGGGGGVCVFAKSSSIELEKGASISRNAAPYGAGVFFYEIEFALYSYDRTGTLDSNETFEDPNTKEHGGNSRGGAGVLIESCKLSSKNGGTINGINFTGNHSVYTAGAIESDQEDVTITNCRFTGNIADKSGGAICIGNDKNTLSNCIITDNVCNYSNSVYEGGGVYVCGAFELELSGKMVVKGNTRAPSGSPDDIFLSDTIAVAAYLTGNVEKSSKVGIRTGTTGDRRIIKKSKNNGASSFFMDLPGYYVSYGTDEGGDAWQRHKTLQFLLQVNGQGSNRYGYNSGVVANGASTDPSKAFWYWSTATTMGLDPIEDYIADASLYNPLLSFAMPQNDVRLVAAYADRIKSAVISVDAPAAGEDLPVSATLQRADNGTGASEPLSVSVTWQKVKSDGAKVPAAGKAKAGTEYVATFSAQQNKELGYFFSQSMAAGDVIVSAGGSDSKAASVSVDAATGALSAESTAFKTEGVAQEAGSGTVTIEMENGGLGASTGSEGETPSVGAGAPGEDDGDVNMIDSVDVSYSQDSESVTVSAPACEGFNFCYWSEVPEGVEADSMDGTATFNAGDIKSALKLGAVYTPVVTSVDLGMDAPVAGEELATSVSSINVKATDGTEFDLLEGFTDAESLPVTWSPGESGVTGKAACSTAYAATAALADDEGFVDVDKVISRNAVVKANGVELPDATVGFTIVDGKLALCAAFPATADKAAADAAAAKAVTGKTVTVKANKKTGKTKRAKSARLKAPASASGAKAKFKVLSASKRFKVNAKTGKVTLKKGAKKGKAYTAKIKVAYGNASKTVKVKFVVK